MEPYRKLWNKQQTEFRRILLSNKQHEQAMSMFYTQHARLHAADMAQTEPWSFADDVLADMTETQIRRIPRNCEHSVAWLLWHMARIEDTAMNLLVAGSPQLLNQADWPAKMNVTICHTGNGMDAESIAQLSATIDIDGLLGYRTAVGRRTREIVQQLTPDALKQKVDPARIRRVMDEGAIIEEAHGIANYWSRRTIAGLLLMPATRHNNVHLNEALKLKQKRQ